MYTVYIHKNKINNKIYVGLTKQSPQQRWRDGGKGYKSQKKFWRAIKKYGWDNFEHIIIQDKLNEKQASLLEQELIKLYDSINNGYNIDLGGTTTNHSLETINKIKNSMYGHYHTEETKQKISENKEKFKKPVICYETKEEYESIQNAFEKTGIDKTSISRVCSGKAITAGGYHWYFKEGMPVFIESKKVSPVYCITNNKAYKTLKEAAIDTHTDASNILKACSGKYKTTNGLKWKKITIEEYYNFDEEN